MKPTDPPDRSIKTAGRVFNIIEVVQQLNGATFTELSEHIEMSESTLYDYLATLSHLGYLSKENGEYNLSLQFFDLGISARNRFQILSKSRSILKQMAEESGAAAWLTVEEEGKAVYLERELGEQSIETHERLGKHEFMHCLASGKAMLAFAPEEHVQNVVDRYGLPKKTPESITSLEELKAELSTIREQGYAINRHEIVEGVSAVAAPIVANDRVYGAVAIAGPEARLENETYQQETIELVTTASNEIELRLTYE
ncbi:IclR family transcriptional regulator [Haloarcula sp. JP-L23]|uniref:IclR family transcriptional regulator n=1 Tax=Haloarcula sp. JP-L23 TaxID=2716717 RepID=UPI00140F14AC|nr:IclR family transcriptional regulator [Haloarcula sp. JP-L23]